MEKLNENEQRVLQVIPVGDERKIKVSDISLLVGINERGVKHIILDLRRKGVPIVSMRMGVETGMFIATSEYERNKGLRAYRSQLSSMTKTVQYIEDADLKNWRDNLDQGGIA